MQERIDRIKRKEKQRRKKNNKTIRLEKRKKADKDRAIIHNLRKSQFNESEIKKKKEKERIEDKIYKSLEINKADFSGHISPFKSKNKKSTVIIRKRA